MKSFLFDINDLLSHLPYLYRHFISFILKDPDTLQISVFYQYVPKVTRRNNVLFSSLKFYRKFVRRSQCDVSKKRKRGSTNYYYHSHDLNRTPITPTKHANLFLQSHTYNIPFNNSSFSLSICSSRY